MPKRKVHNRICNRVYGIDLDLCNATNDFTDKPARNGGGCAHRSERHHEEDCIATREDTYDLTKDPGYALDSLRSCLIHIKTDNEYGEGKNGCGCPTSPNENRLTKKQREEFILNRFKDFYPNSIDCKSIGKEVLEKTGDEQLSREAEDRCSFYKTSMNIYNKKQKKFKLTQN